MGMLSTHWKRPGRPPERDLQLLDILARQAADLNKEQLAKINRDGAGVGLAGMRERVRQLRDEIKIESDGKWTIIRIALPLSLTVDKDGA